VENCAILHRSIVMVSGEPGTAKTLFAMGLGLACDAQTKFLGLETCPGRMLFIGQDSPDWYYQLQAQRLRKGMGISEGQAELLTSEALLNEGYRITSEDFRKELDILYDANPFDILVLDTLFDLHDVDENDNSEMRKIGRMLKRMRDAFHCAIICIGHTAKAGGSSIQYRARGASALAGTVDMTLILEQAGDKVVTIHNPKARGVYGDPLPKRFRVENGPDWCRFVPDVIWGQGKTFDDLGALARPQKRDLEGGGGSSGS
jgi:RecA-family ATPase